MQQAVIGPDRSPAPPLNSDQALHPDIYVHPDHDPDPDTSARLSVQAAGGSLGHGRHAAGGAAPSRRALPLHAADAAVGRGLGALADARTLAAFDTTDNLHMTCALHQTTSYRG